MNTNHFPALFVGHGSPTHAIEESVYTKAWKELGTSLPTPRAILAISAHWLTQGTYVHVGMHPKTIHDFYGFSEALYGITYPAPGDGVLAERVMSLVQSVEVNKDHDWGLDHGTWSVLHRMYPDAQIPVVQLSIDIEKPGAFHYALGKELAPLREEHVLIMGSGNIVHNLGMLRFGDSAAYPWATVFDALVAQHIEHRTHDALIAYEALPDASLAVPTPDHYFPLLYVLGAEMDTDRVSFPMTGIDLGSVSMRSVLLDGISV